MFSDDAIIHRLALAVALAALSGVAAADWVAVSDNDDYVAYADPTTISREGNLVQMSDLVDLKSPRPSPLGTQHSSTLGQNRFDCANQRLRPLALTLHSGQMGEGELVETAAVTNGWLPVAEGTLLKILWWYACSGGEIAVNSAEPRDGKDEGDGTKDEGGRMKEEEKNESGNAKDEGEGRQ